MSINYANFSEDTESMTEPTTAEFMDVVVEKSVDDDKIVETAGVPDKEIEAFEELSTPEPKMGHVECSKLYLRSEPSVDSKEVTILNRDEELMIVSEEDPEWYGVYTAAGQEGFCKKEFIKVD